MNNKNVLITGGAGFIGSHLALKLTAQGYHVTILDNLSPQIHGDDPNSSPLFDSVKEKVNFVKGDVCNRSDWEKVLPGQHVIVHLAAETGTGQSMYLIEKYVQVNDIGTAILLDILANNKHSVEKMVIASSRAIYGEGAYHCKRHGTVFPEARREENLLKGDFEVKCPMCDETAALLATSEDSKIHPSSVYGITKYNQEQMFLTVGSAIGIPAVAFRYQNVYGPGQSLKNPYTGILSIFSTQIKNEEDINIFEDGKESRDFVYIDDVVDATILGIKKDAANGESFNVGTGVATDVSTVANTLIKQYDADVNVRISGNFRLGDIRHNYADLNKIKTKLGFVPSYSFERGIAKFTSWVKSQELSQSNYNQSIEEMRNRGLYK